MSDATLNRTVRQASQTLAISIFCAALLASFVMPVVAVITVRVALKMQAESMRQQMQPTTAR
jgi:hypothetical protein